ncbi:MAG: hypothetical protein ABSB40_00325 [Nitrososphaeria archaeon]
MNSVTLSMEPDAGVSATPNTMSWSCKLVQIPLVPLKKGRELKHI